MQMCTNFFKYYFENKEKSQNTKSTYTDVFMMNYINNNWLFGCTKI